MNTLTLLHLGLWKYMQWENRNLHDPDSTLLPRHNQKRQPSQ